MTGLDRSGAAKEAMRECMRQVITTLVRDLDSVGRANMQVDFLRIEGRRQVEQAAEVFRRATATGWL